MSGTGITVLTYAYNEEFMMPFFLRHYWFADRIVVIAESKCEDRTLEILASCPRVVLEMREWKELDDKVKADETNKVLSKMESGWAMVAESDELVFSAKGESVPDFLARQKEEVVMAKMWQVFRHRSDSDLDPFGVEPVMQRRHGDPDRVGGSTVLGPNCLSCKPCVLRLPFHGKMGIGNHTVTNGLRWSGEALDGVHWRMADPTFAVRRRRNLKDRMCKRQKEEDAKWWDGAKDELIMRECEKHLDDPLLF